MKVSPLCAESETFNSKFNFIASLELKWIVGGNPVLESFAGTNSHLVTVTTDSPLALNAENSNSGDRPNRLFSASSDEANVLAVAVLFSTDQIFPVSSTYTL